jgi:hypothetical protein
MTPLIQSGVAKPAHVFHNPLGFAQGLEVFIPGEGASGFVLSL